MHQKNTLTELLLSIFIPFYIFYWYSETAKTLRQRGASNVPSIKALLWVAISLVASTVLSFIPLLLLPLMMFSGASGNEAAFGIGAGLMLLSIPVIGMIQFGLAVAMMILYILYAIGFSKAVRQVLPGMEQSTIALLCIFIAPVAVYLVQEKINQTSQMRPQA